MAPLMGAALFKGAHYPLSALATLERRGNNNPTARGQEIMMSQRRISGTASAGGEIRQPFRIAVNVGR